MKKVLLVMILSSMPVFAACSIDASKPCTASIIDDTRSTIHEKVLPNPLDDMKKTDAFQPKFVKPYEETLINTETEDYNSNCQFGVCLPQDNLENPNN